MAYTSLTELVRRKGGVKDFGGEIADMLGGRTVRKVRKKTGRVYYSRSGRGIIRRRGMDLDDMRHVAIEEGFLPPDAGVNDLLDALADESRGRIHRSRFEDIELPERQYEEPAKKKRREERPTVSAHPALTKKCKRCGVPHGKGAHRFHGRGAWLRTHLFPFKINPGVSMTIEKARQYVTFYTGLIRHGMQLARQEKEILIQARQLMRRARRPGINPRGKPKRRTRAEIEKRFRRMYADWKKPGGIRGPKKNCNPRGVVVYHRLLKIEARKGPGHRCDHACRRANHSYFHDFSAGAVVYGMPDGSLVIRNNQGKRLWKYF